MRKAISWVGHRAREVLVHLDRWGQGSRCPRVVFLPWGVPEGDSTELRVVNVARSLRDMGWRCVVIPSQMELSQRLRVIRLERPDVIFMQKSRHPANRPRLYAGFPVIYDIDDADFLDERQTEPVAECCRGSIAVIAGGEYVANWCREFNPNVQVVWTGSPIPASRPPVRPKDRDRIIAWAPSSARSQPADMSIVAETVIRLAARGTKFKFRCYGVDNPADIAEFLGRLTAAGIEVTTYPRMPYAQFLKSLVQVAVGLAPFSLDIPYNQGKSFGKVLAYLACDVAVVASPNVEHPKFFRNGQNGMLPQSPAEWVDAAERLLDDADLRQRIADQAWDDFLRELSTPAATRKVAKVIEDVLAAMGTAT